MFIQHLQIQFYLGGKKLKTGLFLLAHERLVFWRYMVFTGGKCCFDYNSFTILKVCKLILAHKSIKRTLKVQELHLNVPLWIKLESDS